MKIKLNPLVEESDLLGPIRRSYRSHIGDDYNLVFLCETQNTSQFFLPPLYDFTQRKVLRKLRSKDFVFNLRVVLKKDNSLYFLVSELFFV